MATVQTNDRMIDRTMHRINKFHTAEIARINRAFLETLPPHGDDIYAHIVGDKFASWVKDAPDGLLNTTETMNLRAFGGITNIGLTIPTRDKMVMPAARTQFESGAIEAGFRQLNVDFEADHEHWKHLKPAVVTLNEKRTKANKDKAIATNFTKRLLREFASLGPCLRAFPPLWDLLDRDDQQRQGARPKGAIGTNVQPFWMREDQDAVKWMTAYTMRMKMIGA